MLTCEPQSLSPTAVEVSLSSGSYVVSEGVGVVTVILEVIGSSSGDVLVRLQTTDGTAIGIHTMYSH